MLLSPNFSLLEATTSQTAVRKGWNNEPNDAVLANMIIAADRMEKVRALFGGRAIMVSSWYRCPKLQDWLNSKGDHGTGFCIDFKVQGESIAAAVNKIKTSGIRFDQLINEYSRWVHISFHPKMRQSTFKIG